MYLLLLTLTLLAGLTLARQLAEPACPHCAAKRWVDHPPRLECARCGWTNTNVATVAPMAVVERLPGH